MKINQSEGSIVGKSNTSELLEAIKVIFGNRQTFTRNTTQQKGFNEM